MGIFKQTQQLLVVEDPATIAVEGETIETTLPFKQQPHQKQKKKQPTIAQWKKARKKERKANTERFVSAKEKRSARIHQLALHSTANRAGAPQNEYCYSPNVATSKKEQSVQKAANVGWGTAQLAVMGLFGKSKKNKNTNSNAKATTNTDYGVTISFGRSDN